MAGAISKQFISVWETIEGTPEHAAIMKFRSSLMASESHG